MGVERRGQGVRRQSQDVPAADSGQTISADHEEEAEGAHVAEQIRVGPLPRARLGRRQGVELKAAGDIVGEDTELLPGAVRPVVIGRDDIEGELLLELADRLLLGAAATDEGEEGREAEGEVGSGGVVLVVPVAWGEEIELEVLQRLMGDGPAVDHHAQAELPLWDLHHRIEAGDDGGEGVPLAALRCQPLEGQPVLYQTEGGRAAPLSFLPLSLGLVR